MTDTEYETLQRDLAARTRKNEICDRCDSESYQQLMGRYSDPAQWKADGWIDSDFVSGAYRYCADCLKKPVETFDWISKIPFREFKQWIVDHPGVFALDEMRVLLPPDNDKGGFTWL